MAIMAALSVQYSKAGIKVFQPSFSPMAVKAFLSPLLALTPPARQISVMPVSVAAFLSLFNKILTILACTDAQISSRFSSINFLLVSSSAKNASLNKLLAPAFFKK